MHGNDAAPFGWAGAVWDFADRAGVAFGSRSSGGSARRLRLVRRGVSALGAEIVACFFQLIALMSAAVPAYQALRLRVVDALREG